MSTVRLLVLGVVRNSGEAHGYAVHRELTSWRVDTWTRVKPPSIYHAIKQLHREGLLSASEPQNSPSGPARVAYRITAAGQRAFFELLEAALQSPDIEEFGAGIAFMRSLPRTRVAALLHAQLETTESIATQLRQMKADWPDPDAPPHAQHLLELWRGTFASNAAWTTQMLARINGGEFEFTPPDQPEGPA
ncbi:PadR family transcriptional regulator [Mycobacterium deserti]|uniref:PadR family transcriptional regulator n=1 Tax=Mycobacterium deserti TaxID=2978347 RepID=A0ABT2M3H8_9MYCO|nr:PadR family transcriptional regulator [Mycobacterium deserti]MCT7656817.1 PadR family transcriptional regulator [Mycobacterium deserti]